MYHNVPQRLYGHKWFISWQYTLSMYRYPNKYVNIEDTHVLKSFLNDSASDKIDQFAREMQGVTFYITATFYDISYDDEYLTLLRYLLLISIAIDNTIMDEPHYGSLWADDLGWVTYGNKGHWHTTKAN